MRNTFAVIIVPEQIGKICPVLGDLTMNAPVLRKVLFESTNPYVMAEALRGTSNSAPDNRAMSNIEKQMSRFILEPPLSNEVSAERCQSGRILTSDCGVSQLKAHFGEPN